MRLAAARIFFVCLALGIAAPASAVFKCDSGGKVSYSDLPCEGGKVLDVNTTPATDADAAARQTAQEKSKLKSLERERHKREAVEAREQQKASKERAARHKKCAAYARRQKWAHEDAARATGLANERAKRKEQRITEEYEAECGRWYEREMSVAR
jgi:hypothetical protein